MNALHREVTAGLLASFALTASAVTHYVDLNSANPTPPYTNWATAASVIQDAVDAAVMGDEILVTNGIYATGGRAVSGAMTNRVALTKLVKVRSVNGPACTEIRGYQIPGDRTGDGAIRCAYLSSGASLTGFKLTGGATRRAGTDIQERSGGGVWSDSSGTVSNCVIVGNWAAYRGGGAYYGALKNCTILANSAGEGGGVYNGALTGCVLSGNSATNTGGGTQTGTAYQCIITGNGANAEGGGAYSGSLHDCIVYYNSARTNANSSRASLYRCCTLPSPGGYSIESDPQLASLSHLSSDSPCRGAGSASYASGVDIDGESWANPPSIGCDEFIPGAVTGALSPAIQVSHPTITPGLAVGLTAMIEGRLTASRWEFEDGTVLSNKPYASCSWATTGEHLVLLRAYNESNPSGIAATALVQVVEQPVHYVARDNVTPELPYSTWQTAATNIQDAVDAASVPGALVLVADGVYDTGASSVYGSNRVAVMKPLMLRSLNGPNATTIRGGSGVPCVYLTNGAAMTGFTLTSGSAGTGTPGDVWFRSGGGILCESTNASVSDCLLVSNTAAGFAGGAMSGTLSNCEFIGNLAPAAGGACLAVLRNCTLATNSAFSSHGGGAYQCWLDNCVLYRNSGNNGGGAYRSKLTGCTVVQNSAWGDGGGGSASTFTNCIVYDNTSPLGDNYDRVPMFMYSCTFPLPTSGMGNISSAPAMVDAANGNLRLQSTSPCINAGNNAYVTSGTDLDDNPRIVGGTVDIGAYEYQSPASALSYAWLQQYGLPADGSADFADTDLDGHNNWQEWRTDTVPTNAMSRLTLPTPTNGPTGVAVTWQSVPTRSYFLERGTNLAGVPVLLPLAANLPGQPGTTTFTDTTATNAGPFFYRVGVQ